MLQLRRFLFRFQRFAGSAARHSFLRGQRYLVGGLLLLWSVILGWGLAQVISAQVTPAQVPSAQVTTAPVTPAQTGTVDVVPEGYALGQQFYLENCATCHVGLPPAVMPSQTWSALIQDTQHYGAQIPPIVEPSLEIMWKYLSTYSRPVIQRERIPYRLDKSRYFKALHPRVEFTEPIGPSSCISCHPGAPQFDYRTLTPAWENAP